MKKTFIIIALLIIASNLINAQTNNIIKAIYIDEYGMKWFGSEDGLFRFDGTNWINYISHNKIPKQISDIEYQSSDFGSELWIASDSGVSVATFDVDGVTSATLYTTGNSGILSNNVYDIIFDKDNVRYFASPEGVGIFNKSTWLSVEKGTKIPNASVLSLGSINDTIYVGTNGKGVGRLIKNEVDAYSGATCYETPWAGLVNNTINCVYIDSKKYQWYGTTEGVSRHEVQESPDGWNIYLTKEQGLVDGNVKSITEDSEGNIWFGTDGGVSKYNLAEDQFTNFTIEDGLPDNTIYDIAVDKDNSIWFATGKGVSHFDGSNFNNYLLTGIETNSYHQNFRTNSIYPNPATTYIHINYYVKNSGFTNITAFNLSGKKIKTIFNGYSQSGKSVLNWNLNDSDGNPVPSGIYFITIKSKLFVNTVKMVVI